MKNLTALLMALLGPIPTTTLTKTTSHRLLEGMYYVQYGDQENARPTVSSHLPDGHHDVICVAVLDGQKSLVLPNNRVQLDAGVYTSKKPLTLADGLLKHKKRDSIPLVVYSWHDPQNTAGLKDIGNQYANGVKDIAQHNTEAHLILIGVGRGCLLMDYATALLKKPVTVIQVGGAVLPQEDLYKEFQPTYNHVLDFYFFYNGSTYSSDAAGAVQPKYEVTPQDDPKLKRIHTVVNNRITAVHDIKFLMLQDVLDACASIKKNFTTCRDFWCSFSNIKPETHTLVGLSVSFRDASAKEKDLSNKNEKIYKKNWGNSVHKVLQNPTSAFRDRYKLSNATQLVQEAHTQKPSVVKTGAAPDALQKLACKSA